MNFHPCFESVYLFIFVIFDFVPCLIRLELLNIGIVFIP
jgi:hypothetical protein